VAQRWPGRQPYPLAWLRALKETQVSLTTLIVQTLNDAVAG
jgi:hypothetical protein